MLKRYIGDRAFYKRVLLIAVPIIVQNGITNFVSLLDNIMVGQVGTDTIACSASDMWKCLVNTISWGVPEEEAVRAATLNPACAISADKEIGSIEEGKLADFLVCAPDYSSKRVFLGGKEL